MYFCSQYNIFVFLFDLNSHQVGNAVICMWTIQCMNLEIYCRVRLHTNIWSLSEKKKKKTIINSRKWKGNLPSLSMESAEWTTIRTRRVLVIWTQRWISWSKWCKDSKILPDLQGDKKTRNIEKWVRTNPWYVCINTS